VRNSNGSGANGLVYLLGDHLGSTSITADPVDGDKLSELRFRAWGETRYAFWILRVRNEWVLTYPEGVLRSILAACQPVAESPLYE
jgi:hypothetical protein